MSALDSTAAYRDWQSLSDIDVSLHQHFPSRYIDAASFHCLLSSITSIHFRALAHSLSMSHVGDWLSVVLSASLGLYLQDWEFWCCQLYWLGVPHHINLISCPRYHNATDTFGDHQVGSSANGDCISCHNTIRDVVFSNAQSAILAPSNETLGLVSSSHSRPAGILLLIGAVAILLPWTSHH